jgi:hypothetical protein
MEETVLRAIMPCYLLNEEIVQMVKNGKAIITVRKKNGEIVDARTDELQTPPVCIYTNSIRCPIDLWLKNVECNLYFSCKNYTTTSPKQKDPHQ